LLPGSWLPNWLQGKPMISKSGWWGLSSTDRCGHVSEKDAGEEFEL
jgi:hypothetical protein